MKRITIAAAAVVTALLGCSDPTSVDEATSVVRGSAFLDRNGDGLAGTGDVPIAGASVVLLRNATGDTVARAQTAADGAFLVDGVPSGTYRLEVGLGAMSDSLTVVSVGTSPLVVAARDTVTTTVRVGYAGTTATISAARALAPGTRVIVHGVALSASAAFGDSTLHLKGAAASIRAIGVRDAVNAGDSVRLSGTISMLSGQPVIVASAAIVARAGVGVAVPGTVTTDAAARAANGTLDAGQVSVSGIVLSVAPGAGGSTLVTIDDGSGALTLELRPSVGFNPASFEAGQSVRARGVLVPSSDGTRWLLRPRAASEALVTAGIVRCSNGFAGQYPCRDVDLASFVPLLDLGGGAGFSLNDIWGWTDPQTGREYAIVGRTNGTSFVDVTDPVRPVVVANLPKTATSPSSTWRDIKVYQNHAYIVADGAGAHGMQVLDLTRLRQYAGTLLQLTPDAVYTGINSAHNIVINEATGFAYAVGSSAGGTTCGGGLHMIDVRTPKSPAFAGCFSDALTGRAATGYTHDAQCVVYSGPDGRYTGREICFGSNETSLSIADVTDRAAPRALSRASYPDVAYSHQAWLTDDQRFLYMNDELDELQGRVSRTRTLVWDVTDLEDPQLVSTYLGVEPSTDHNLYIRGNLMYQSNYASGLRILDISARSTPEEIGFFDTTPLGTNGPGYSGSWSNYPFFGSGVIVISSMGEGLFVLRRR